MKRYAPYSIPSQAVPSRAAGRDKNRWQTLQEIQGQNEGETFAQCMGYLRKIDPLAWNDGPLMPLPVADGSSNGAPVIRGMVGWMGRFTETIGSAFPEYRAGVWWIFWFHNQ